MEQYEILEHVIRCLESIGVSYLITGSMASMAYGEPRFTNDVDIVAELKEEHLEELKKCFPEEEFYLSEEAIRKAIKERRQFNIIHPASGFKIDIMIRKAEAFDDSRFQRLRRFKATESREADFASPEDVIIKKMEFYKKGGSEKHLRDITGILKVTGETIDYGYIGCWAGKMELNEIWDALLKRVNEMHK